MAKAVKTRRGTTIDEESKGSSYEHEEYEVFYRQFKI